MRGMSAPLLVRLVRRLRRHRVDPTAISRLICVVEGGPARRHAFGVYAAPDERLKDLLQARAEEMMALVR
jgi:hypothetical protein